MVKFEGSMKQNVVHRKALKRFRGLVLLLFGLAIIPACKESVQFDESALLSSISSPSPLSAPNTPTNFSIDIASSSSLFLSWTSGGGTTSSYRIAYQLGFSPPSDCNSGTVQNTSSTSLSLTGLSAGKVYSLRVCSLNSDGDLDNSGGITSSATPSAYCAGTKLTDAPFANSSSGGDGLNVGSAFKICTATQLATLSSNSAYWGFYYQLENNIDLTGVSMNPIGNATNKFSGTFDGQGYLINGLSISKPSDDHVGLFGYIDFGGSVTNLGLINVNIVGFSNVGGLAGRTNGVISKVFVSGNVQGQDSLIGGVVGVTLQTFLTEVAFEGSILGNSLVGGVAGAASLGGLSDCYAQATITSSGSGIGYTGGILGAASLAQISKCYYAGTLSAPNLDTIAGGIGSIDTSSQAGDLFADAQVTGKSGTTSLFLALLTGTPVLSNLYFNANQSCTSSCINSGVGLQSDSTTGLAVSSSYFYDKTNAPMVPTWDFTNTWQEHPDTYPTLRNVPQSY